MRRFGVLHELGEFVCAEGNVWVSNLSMAGNGVDASFVSDMPDTWLGMVGDRWNP